MAPGVSPAPFVVNGNSAGNRAGAIRMWQSRLSFAVGLLLSTGSAITVAESGIQTGQAPQSRALSVAEFARLADAGGPAVSSEGVPAQPVPPPAPQPEAAVVSASNERRVRSISLVKFVEQADAEGNAGQVPRISLVDLPPDPQADTDTAAPPPRVVERPLDDNAPRLPEAGVAPERGPGRYTPGLAEPQRTAPDDEVHAAIQHRHCEERSDVAIHGTGVTGEHWIAAPCGLAMTEVVSSSMAMEEAVPDEEAMPGGVADDVAQAPIQPRVVERPLGDNAPHLLEEDVAPEHELGRYTPDSDKLQLADAVHSALREHPAIVESLSRLDQQQEQVSVARAGYWPQLRSGINTGYRHTTGRSEEALSLSASQMLYDFGKVSSAVEAAASGVDREQASVLLAAEDLIRETAQAFIEARRYEELLALATEQIGAIGELEALAEKRSALGASSASDQVQAQARREAARATQLQVQAQRDQWHRTLENLIGSSQQLTLDAVWPRTMEGFCQRLPENFEGAPRVLVAEAERAEAEASIRQARAEQRPTLSLSADFEHYLNRDSRGFQELDDQELVVSLNLTSNLFQGGALRARSRAAEHALYSANAARDRALLELSRLYRQTRDRSRSLTASLALQDERHASIARTQELYRHQYLSLGTRTLLDILNTEQEIFQTRVDKQNTLFDLRSLQIDCLYSVGGLREAFRAADALNRRVASRTAQERS